MQTIAFFSQKGGSGKSTLAIHSAVAAGHRQKVVLIDCDPQGTTAAWGKGRTKTEPVVAQASSSNLDDVLSAAAAEGMTLAILDCPPHVQPGVAQMIAKADFVVVPVQPTMPDLAAIGRALDLVRAAKRPFGFVVNRAPARAPEIDEAITLLQEAGEVCPVAVHDRRSLSRALASHLAVLEFDREDTKAALEVSQVWLWLRKKLSEKKHG